MRFAVSIVAPANYPHIEATREVAETIYYGLVGLDHDTILTHRIDCPDRRHIIFCSHLLRHVNASLRAGSILYNLEQIAFSSGDLPPTVDLYRRYPVWDYSRRNIESLCCFGINQARHLPVGYVPQLTRIPRDEEDIDVLFFGSVNERRGRILSALRDRGVRTEVVFGLYGAARDRLIARSKIVLNLHYYESKVFEVVRVSNRRFVVSERGCDPAEDAEFAPGVVFAEYEGLVDACVAYLERPDERRRIAEAGFELMVRRDMREYLKRVIDGL